MSEETIAAAAGQPENAGGNAPAPQENGQAPQENGQPVVTAAARAGEAGGEAPAPQDGVVTAAARAGKAGAAAPAPQDGNPAPQETEEEARAADEAYAKEVLPDGADGTAPDRSLVAAMARELRAAKVPAETVRTVAGIYDRAAQREMGRLRAEREARIREMNAAADKEFSSDDWKNVGAAWRAFVAGDERLRDALETTELGSTPAMIRILALAGTAVREDGRITAPAGGVSGGNDTDRAVFMATVPKDLR